ncbi:hypothetical protein GCM10017673_56750 [Streptosporangium violaceochromogenes]|nr:hypothetical protein GCM10017673_56750 [Streptosporangium violaceochromogenes]
MAGEGSFALGEGGRFGRGDARGLGKIGPVSRREIRSPREKARKAIFQTFPCAGLSCRRGGRSG